MKRLSKRRVVINMAAASGTGLKKETAAALSALLGPTIVVPVLFLLLEKDSFVRFYAMQSLVVFISLYILNWVLIFSIFLAIVSPLVFIVGVILWLILTYKAWQGDRWEVPLLGKIAKQLIEKA